MVGKSVVFAGLLLLATSIFAQDSDQKSADPQKEEIINKLQTTKISVDFKDVKLADIIDLIRDLTRMNILIDKRTDEKLAKDEQDKKGSGDNFTIKLKDVSLKLMLKFLLEPKDLAIIYQDGVLLIVPKEILEAKTIVRMYDVRDLLFKVKDFPAPKMSLDTTASVARKGIPGGVFILPDEQESKPAMTADELIKTIKSVIGEEKWKDDKNTSIEIVGEGLLIIRQTVEVQNKIEKVILSLHQVK